MFNTEEVNSETTEVQLFTAPFHYVVVSVKRSLKVEGVFA